MGSLRWTHSWSMWLPRSLWQKTSVVTWIKDPWKVNIQIQGTIECVSFHGRRDFADMIGFSIIIEEIMWDNVWCAWSLSRVWLCSPMYWAHQTPLSLGILQERILEWVAMPSSSGFSQPRDRTQVSCIAGRFFTIWATREAQIVRVLLPPRSW